MAIDTSLSLIVNRFAEEGYGFVYIPKIYQEISKSDIVEYYYPWVNKSDIGNVLTPQGNDFILQFIAVSDAKGLVGSYFFCIDPEYSNEALISPILKGVDIVRQIDIYIAELEQHKSQSRGNSGVRFSFSTPPGSLTLELSSNHTLESDFNANEIFSLPNPNIRCQTDADADFEVKSKVLMNEVKERIEQLRQYGVAEQVLLSLVKQPVKLSRLVITADYGIFLPEYNNQEVKMSPLAKAVFFLFCVMKKVLCLRICLIISRS